MRENTQMLDDQKLLEEQRNQGAAFLTLVRVLPLQGLEPLEILKAFVSEFGNAPCGYFQKSAEKDGHYQPTETLFGFGLMERVSVNEESAGQNPFENLSEYLKKYRTVTPKDVETPTSGFNGGAMGRFNYESVKYLEPTLKKAAGSFSSRLII